MSLKEETIQIDETAWVHESALLFGNISVGRESSIWPNAVMRAEMFHIEIGARTNIQDFVLIHVGATTPTIIGDDCSITHHATLHGCKLGDKCLVGINSSVANKTNADFYVLNAKNYRQGIHRITEDELHSLGNL